MAEIHEVEPYYSPIDVLYEICTTGQDLAYHCEQFFFYQDDGEISEDEAFLLEWIRAMEKDPEAAYNKLIDTAYKLQDNMRW